MDEHRKLGVRAARLCRVWSGLWNMEVLGGAFGVKVVATYVDGPPLPACRSLGVCCADTPWLYPRWILFGQFRRYRSCRWIIMTWRTWAHSSGRCTLRWWSDSRTKLEMINLISAIHCRGTCTVADFFLADFLKAGTLGINDSLKARCALCATMLPITGDSGVTLSMNRPFRALMVEYPTLYWLVGTSSVPVLRHYWLWVVQHAQYMRPGRSCCVLSSAPRLFITAPRTQRLRRPMLGP